MKQDNDIKPDMKIISTKEFTVDTTPDKDIKIIRIILLLLVIFNGITTYNNFDKKIDAIDTEFSEILENVIIEENNETTYKENINTLAEKKYEMDKLHKKQTYYLIFYTGAIITILYTIIITKQ